MARNGSVKNKTTSTGSARGEAGSEVRSVSASPLPQPVEVVLFFTLPFRPVLGVPYCAKAFAGVGVKISFKTEFCGLFFLRITKPISILAAYNLRTFPHPAHIPGRSANLCARQLALLAGAGRGMVRQGAARNIARRDRLEQTAGPGARRRITQLYCSERFTGRKLFSSLRLTL